MNTRESVETGKLLFVKDGWRCEVYSDPVGTVAFFIYDSDVVFVLEENSRTLEFANGNLVVSKVLTRLGVGFMVNLHMKHA